MAESAVNRATEVNQPAEQEKNNAILTVPNILSMFRLALIPIFLWTYLALDRAQLTAALIVLSFLTDVADGFIARRFHQTSELGKALDPIADKLTQFAMLLCLTGRFPVLIGPLVLFAIKEFATGIASLCAINRSGEIKSARWHGKITTFLIYALLVLHILWGSIPAQVSAACASLTTAMMLLSFVLYMLQNIRIVKSAKQNNGTKAAL